MPQWTIKSVSNEPICTVKSVERHGQLMSGRWLTVDIDSPIALPLSAGCYIDFNNVRYSIRSQADVEKSARPQSHGGAFTYKDLRLDDVSWQELEDTQMCDYVYGDNHLHYSGLGTFSFYAVNASDVGYRVLANLANKYGDSAWDVRINGSSIKSDYTDYTFDEAKSIGISSGTSVKECLDLLWSNWGVYYTVENHVVDIITSSNGVSIPLRYGKNNGLKSIRRKINQNVEICTRVRAYGSERNMPYKWYNNKYNSVFGDAMYVPQLMLPHYAYIKSQNEIEFIDENGDLYDDRPPHYQYNLWTTPSDIVLPSNNDIIQKYGKRDKEVHWNSDEMGEIFPSMKGMTSDDIPALREIYGDHFHLDHLLSTAVNEDGTPITGTGDTSELTTGKINFKVRVPNPGFDPMAQKGQEDVVLLMQSGMCQSRGFVILKSEAITDNEQVVAYNLTCVKAIDDEIDQVFPNFNYTINGGDEYVYTGLTFSGNDLSNSWLAVYIGAAEKRLLRAAALWLREHQTEQYVYEITPDNVYLQRQKDENENFDITEGDFVTLSQDDLGDSDEVVETVTVVYGKDAIPTYEITFLKRDESESLGDRVKGLVGQTISVDSDIAKMNDSLYRKVNKAGFHTLFDPLDAQYNVLDINGDLSTLRYIRANVDFFGVSGVTALGRSSGGGGGGGSADLNALLDSINGSSIGNTLPTLSENGKCPVWVQTTNNDGHWEWGTTGGGGGTGTLPNDIAYWDDDDGTVIYVDENGNVVSLAEYAKKTWVEEKIAQIPSSSFNEEAMWTALGTNESTKIIDDSHISATIKSGAAAGATAIQQSDLNTALGSYYTKTEANGLFVHLTGNVNEIITGVKTFSNDIVATRIKIGNAYISYNSNGLCIDDGNGGSMNLYATGGVSSLGIGSSSGGGASSLSELSDVNISSLVDGQGLVYDSATQKWVNGTVGGGGGGGISLADVWTSLAANNTSNKIHFSHLPNTIHVVDALHVDQSGHLENYNGAIFDLPSHSYRSTPYTLATTEDIQNIDLTDYALKSWVEGKNYLTGNQTITLSGDVSGSGTTSITTTIGTGRVTNAMLAGNIANSKLLYSRITIGNTSVSLGGTLSASALLNDLDDTFDGRYVTRGTEQEITASKTFKSTASLTVEASLTASNDIYLNKRYQQQWVNFNNKTKNFSFGQELGGDCVLYSGVPDYEKEVVNFYTNINGNPYSLFIQGSTGNVGIGKNNPTYKFDVSGNIHTNSGYYLDSKLLADNNVGLNIGYGFAAAATPLSTTIWGEGISFRSTDGTNNYTYGGCTKIDDTHGNITYGIMATDFIGVTNKFRFEYDLQNNTVWVLKADGTAVNFASLGGVTSLGVGASGTPNISSMNIATLTSTTVNATTLNNSVIKPINGYGPVIEAPYIEGNDEEDTYGVVFNYNTRSSHYLTDFYNIGLLGEDADENETWSIEPNGSAVFASANVSTLKVGSSGSSISKILWDETYLQVTIGTKIYKFIPDQTSNA